MVCLIDGRQYLICKEILINFCKNFKTLPKSNYAFLEAQKTLLSSDPHLTSYFYQFLLSSALHERTFKDEEIMRAFENKFKIKDIYPLNGGLSDHTTLNTAFIVIDMIKNPKSGFKKLPFTILSSPLDYTSDSYKQLKKDPKVVSIREKSMEATGQSNCDLQIGDHFYDIKHSGSVSSNKNIISPQTYETIVEKSAQHLKSVYYHLLISEKKYKVAGILRIKLEQIIKDKNLTPHQQNAIWNEIIVQNFDRIPAGLCLPIVYEITSNPYSSSVSKKFREYHRIPQDIVDKPVSARKAIAGVLNQWDIDEYKRNAMIITENGLPNLPHVNKDEYLD